MSRDRSPPEFPLLGGKYVEVAPTKETRTKGTLFIEARLKDGLLESGTVTFESCEAYAKVLETQLVKHTNAFFLLEEILADEYNAECKLGIGYEEAKAKLQSLKVVEYIGPAMVEKCFSSSKVGLKVQVFQLHNNTSSDDTGNEDGQLGEVIPMPNARFEGVWDELVFDRELKEDLIWMMTNILRFSKAFEEHKIRRKLNPLILLHGPPGTGKTSLCLGLAQKISVRLSSTYKSTKLIQIKTAILLSKYYSESAKHVDDIFNMIIAMCEERSDGFVCVLIDEVESIASSRVFSTQHGESLDSMRATNALLTGLDRTAPYTNVVFLFTSNMCDALEPAFLDRCGLKEFVGPPSMAAQYEILRGVLERLINCQVVQSANVIPQYKWAVMDATVGALTSNLPGPKLLEIIKLIHSSTDGLGTQISGRSLGQLPEKALMRYLRGEECDLDLALGLLRKCVLETLKVCKVNADCGEVELAKDIGHEVKKRDCNDVVKTLDETEPENIHEEPDILGDMKTWDSTDTVDAIHMPEPGTIKENKSNILGDTTRSATVTTNGTVDGARVKRKMSLAGYREFMQSGRKFNENSDSFNGGDHGKVEKRTKV